MQIDRAASNAIDYTMDVDARLAKIERKRKAAGYSP
jgi:hypothetical protein